MLKTLLPKDLTKLTEVQYRAAVCQLSRKPLHELHRQQILIKRREQRAHRQNDTRALDNLYVIDRITTDAVFEHEFGPSICRRPKRK